MNPSIQTLEKRTRTVRRVLRSALAPLFLAVAVIYPVVGRTAPADGDSESRPLPESEVQPPAFPQAENLIPFNVSATTENQFLIDSESLTLSNDDVVRFTLVIVSPAGARNVSYEAINCRTSERRLYALGQSDQTWSKARSSQWVKIRDNTLNRHYAALYTDYFCPIGISIRSVEEARQVLRRGGHPSVRQH